MLDVIASTMRSALMPIMTNAGSIHACPLAQEINVPRVLIPPSPGTTCALGPIIADFKANNIRSSRAPFGRRRHRRRERRFSRDGDGNRGVRLTGQRKPARPGPANHRFGGYPLYRLGLNSRSESAGFVHRSDLCCRDSMPVPRHLRGRLQEQRSLGGSGTDQSAHPHRRAVAALHPTPAAAGPARLGPRAVGAPPDLAWLRFHDAAVFNPGPPLAGRKVTGPAIIEQYDIIAVVARGFVAGPDAHGILSLTDSC